MNAESSRLRHGFPAALLLLIASCGGDGGAGPAGPSCARPGACTGTILGTVSVEGSPAPGVTVSVQGPTQSSSTTDNAGTYRFTDCQTGSYTVTIGGFPEDVTFDPISKTTSISSNGQVATVNFSGQYVRTSMIQGLVLVGGSGLRDVTVNTTQMPTVSLRLPRPSRSGWTSPRRWTLRGRRLRPPRCES
jgi:hypothetical protein